MPVIASYHALRNRVVKGNDGLFAEPVKLFFLKDGKNDPDREDVEIIAPLRTGGGKNTNLAGGFARSWRSRLVAQAGELHIDMATYQGPKPVKGDKVRAISRDGEPWFEVLHNDDRNHTRMVLELGEA